VKAGHDATWVAHPTLVSVAKEIFDDHMRPANQIANRRADVHVSAADLLTMPRGTITETGVRTNIDVGIQYLASWLAGNGCVPIYNLMEDAATAEISRTQLWQWLRHGARLVDGRTVTRALLENAIDSEITGLIQRLGRSAFDHGRYASAAELFTRMTTDEELAEFLTLVAYDYLE
jgi:malate synthase